MSGKDDLPLTGVERFSHLEDKIFRVRETFTHILNRQRELEEENEKLRTRNMELEERHVRLKSVVEAIREDRETIARKLRDLMAEMADVEHTG